MRRAIKVSEKVYRNLCYAGRVYNKTPSDIVQKLLDAPLNLIDVCPHCGNSLYADKPKLPLKPQKKAGLPLSNIDGVKKGLALLEDIDPDKAKQCRERLNALLSTGLPF